MRKFLLLMLIGLFAFVVAACGGGDEEPTAAPPPTAVPTATTAPPPTAATAATAAPAAAPATAAVTDTAVVTDAAPVALKPAPGLAPGDPEAGKAVFLTLCFACHGPDGKGIPGLGKDMTDSEFIASKTDEELFAFVRIGRPIEDPLNTTGVAMPPSGGNPALTDQDVMNIIAFIRTIHVN